MQIILKEYVKGLGEKGDVVTVKNGYARNFLIPNGMAMIASKSNMKVLEENTKQAAHRQEHIKVEAEKLGEQLSAVKLQVTTLAGVDGKLFGSVTPTMVWNQLNEKGFDVDRKRIIFPSDIKQTGTHKVIIDLHKEVKAELEMVVDAKDSPAGEKKEEEKPAEA